MHEGTDVGGFVKSIFIRALTDYKYLKRNGAVRDGHLTLRALALARRNSFISLREMRDTVEWFETEEGEMVMTGSGRDPEYVRSKLGIPSVHRLGLGDGVSRLPAGAG